MNWRENRSMLQSWLNHSRVGLVTDMDGTISYIANEPDKATVTPKNLELLQQLNQHFALVAVVSGRAVRDVAQKVGIPDLVYIGNHGIERLDNGNVIVAPEITAIRPRLESVIADLQPHLVEGMLLEDKHTTLSIHYRNTANPAGITETLTPIIKRIATDNELETFAGRMIFEIRPPIEINKGIAFQYLVDTYSLDAAMFIGDDTTDVDAFKVAKHLRETDQCYSFAVGVESADMPDSVADTADMMVAGVSDTEEFLSWLLSAVRASFT